MFQHVQRQFDGSVFSVRVSRVAGVDVEENGPGTLLEDPPSLNLLFVLFTSAVATVAYASTNLVAPSEARNPMVFTLGVLTGLTSLIPIVVTPVSRPGASSSTETACTGFSTVSWQSSSRSSSTTR